MNSLVQLALDAHGGLERWRRFEHVSAHLRNGGVLWTLKHQQGVIDDVNVRVALRREWASHSPFVEPDWRTSFEPHRVAIEATDGSVIEERLTPRDSFAGQRPLAGWAATIAGTAAAHTATQTTTNRFRIIRLPGGAVEMTGSRRTSPSSMTDISNACPSRAS